MVFKSFTYDSSEMDLQYALDEQGSEIREIIYDIGFSGMNHWTTIHTSSSNKNLHFFIEKINKTYTYNFSPESGEWHIRHKPSRKNVKKEDLYEDITFYLIIERKPMYYVFNIILPCILITIIAIFNFYLPPDAGETQQLKSATFSKFAVIA